MINFVLEWKDKSVLITVSKKDPPHTNEFTYCWDNDGDDTPDTMNLLPMLLMFIAKGTKEYQIFDGLSTQDLVDLERWDLLHLRRIRSIIGG